ncbi:MAG: hypothetical protein QOK10_1489 [Pseudonocardiales bacterium]|jgi:hypothetical protein|nr:hypothetical protein [Pseudonocardiales bacterium]
MQGWIVVGVWAFAVVLAIVLLGFGTYELSWKFRRLRTDERRLEGVIDQLRGIAADLEAAADRASMNSSGPYTTS